MLRARGVCSSLTQVAVLWRHGVGFRRQRENGADAYGRLKGEQAAERRLDRLILVQLFVEHGQTELARYGTHS